MSGLPLLVDSCHWQRVKGVSQKQCAGTQRSVLFSGHRSGLYIYIEAFV